MSEEQEKRMHSRQQLEEKGEEDKTAGSFNMADVGAVAAAQLLVGLHPSSFTELQLDGWMREWMKAKLSHCIQGNLLDLLDKLMVWLVFAGFLFYHCDISLNHPNKRNKSGGNSDVDV